MTQEQFISNTNFQDELLNEVQKRTFLNRCEVIRRWMEQEEKIIQENTLDIPDFLKPKEFQFESRLNNGIRNAVRNNTFWDVYDNALGSVGC